MDENIMTNFPIDPDHIQYMGIPGHSKACLLAVDTIVNSELPPERASVVTWEKDRYTSEGEHLFLFWDWNSVPLTVVHSGFASGYPGEGPRSFSEALCMIWDRQIPANKIYSDKGIFNTIERRGLTAQLIDWLRSFEHSPSDPSWMEGMLNSHLDLVESGQFWQLKHSSKLVFDFLDPEIIQRCRSTFENNPEAAVSAAYKVVEERLRTLVGTGQELFGARLVKQTLDPNSGVLTDMNLQRGEREGMFQLFDGAMKIGRNPRSHRFLDNADPQVEIEHIYLADLLLRMLSEGKNDGNSSEATSEKP